TVTNTPPPVTSTNTPPPVTSTNTPPPVNYTNNPPVTVSLVDDVTLQLPQAGDSALHILSPSLLELVHINTQPSGSTQVSDCNFSQPAAVQPSRSCKPGGICSVASETGDGWLLSGESW